MKTKNSAAPCFVPPPRVEKIGVHGMATKWMTRIDFKKAAAELFEALCTSSAYLLCDPNDRENIFLGGSWLLESDESQSSSSFHNNDYLSVVSLVRRPIFRQRKMNRGTKERVEEMMNMDLFIADSELSGDDHQREHEEDPSTFQSRYDEWIEWNFSVVYNETWCAPVLFFQVAHADGAKLSRNEVLEELEWDETSDSWQFLSEEEHPVTGAPTYFLHPCQTWEHLNILFRSGTSIYDDDVMKNDINSLISLSKGQVLLSWLALMVSSLQMKIRPKHYVELQRLIQTNKINKPK